MSSPDDYADLFPVPLRNHCVWRGLVYRNHDLWADENVCSRCHKTITDEGEPAMCTDMHGNKYGEHTKNPGSCHRCGNPTGYPEPQRPN